jgi:hypothetical protein
MFDCRPPRFSGLPLVSLKPNGFEFKSNRTTVRLVCLPFLKSSTKHNMGGPLSLFFLIFFWCIKCELESGLPPILYRFVRIAKTLSQGLDVERLLCFSYIKTSYTVHDRCVQR